VDVLLAKSSVQASSATSPTVKVTFALRFNHSTAGRHFKVAAAATNDAGGKAGFKTVGTINVT